MGNNHSLRSGRRILAGLSLFSLAVAMSLGEDTPKSNWTIAGTLELYGGFSSPDTGIGATRANRQFDFRNGEVRIATGQLNIKYADAKSGWGFSITPFFGDNADTLFGYELDTSKIYNFIAEGYLTYNFKGGKTTVDIGKFYSWIGLEGVESWGNDAYSRGLVYTLGQPNYHFGSRLNYTIDKKWGASLYATQGWNSVKRGTSGATGGFQLRYNPSDATSYTLGYISGREGADTATSNNGLFGGIGYATAGGAQTDLIDLIVTHQISPRLKFSFNSDYASAHGPTNSGTWFSQLYMLTYQTTKDLQVVGRVENFNDYGGLRTGVGSTVQSALIGLNLTLDAKQTVRFDLRTDSSNQAIFTDSKGPSRQQTTLNLAYIYKF